MEEDREGMAWVSGRIGQSWVSNDELKVACCGLCCVSTTLCPPTPAVALVFGKVSIALLCLHMSGFCVGNIKRLNSRSGHSHGMEWRQCVLSIWQ